MRIICTILTYAGIVYAITPYHVNNSTNNATTPHLKLSSVTHLTAAKVTPEACGTKTVTFYETATAAPSPKVKKPFGYNQDNFQNQAEGSLKLQPCTHWTHDKKNPNNLIPKPVGEKTSLYYAENGDASKFV
jgi:hypothetical protein